MRLCAGALKTRGCRRSADDPTKFNAKSLSDAAWSAFDPGSLLMFSGLKPISVFNFATATIALSLSLYTFIHDQVRDWEQRSQETNRMLFGGYKLGRGYSKLVLCTQADPYAMCDHRTVNADFAKLEPMAAVLLQSAVDWPALRGSGKIEGPWEINNDFLNRASIVNDALDAHFEDERVRRAFVLGEAVSYVLDLGRNPATKYNAELRTKYSGVVNVNANDAISKLGAPCGKLDPDPAAFNAEAIDKFEACLTAKWVQNSDH